MTIGANAARFPQEHAFTATRANERAFRDQLTLHAQRHSVASGFGGDEGCYSGCAAVAIFWTACTATGGRHVQ